MPRAKKDASPLVESPVPQEPEWVAKSQKAYEEGASDVEVCAIIGITETKFHELYQKHTAFKNLVDIGRMRSKAWWYQQVRLGLKGQFNTPAWVAVMRNRFGWTDKSENHQAVPTENLSYEDILKRIRQLTKEVEKQNGKLLTDAEIVSGSTRRN